MTHLVCSGCGAEPSPDNPFPFRCPNARPADDVDHVLRRQLDTDHRSGDWRTLFLDEEPNPFIRFRRLFHSYNVAIENGVTDHDYVSMASSIDRAINQVDGTGFRETPFAASMSLNSAIGRRGGSLLIKNETGNVSGSHKARHLMGILLWLETAKLVGLISSDDDFRLAIASCGNAALGAAVVAKAVGRILDVFIPTDAHPSVVARLTNLGATLSVCPREEGRPGDPCVHQFHEAIEGGAQPFSVQGNENGLAIEGGLTLGYEMVSSLLRSGETVDRLFVQVGGGALASACIEAFRDAESLGLIDRLPRIHAVQPTGASPLSRAWTRVARMIETGLPPGDTDDSEARTPATDQQRAAILGSPDLAERRTWALSYAATHRSRFMWPWEETPHSIAHGILDDETYDWLVVIEAMVATGGYPIVVSEDDLRIANDLARSTTSIPVDHTGSAGLAGCLSIVREGLIPDDESIAVLFTGRERGESE